MSALTDILPARSRKHLYAGYSAVGLGIGAVQVGYASANVDQPAALTVLLAVYAYVGVGLGLTAASNTSEPAAPAGDDGHSTIDTLLLIATTFGVLLLLLGVQLNR